MGILSIQSQVISGHVGNSAAVFALQRLGAEIWPIPTTLLSHHPGHGGAQGGPLPASLLQSLVDGLSAHGCLNRCEAVLSGYLASPANAEVVLNALAEARKKSKNCVYLCDPVLGDDGRTYVSPDVETAVHNLAAFADILTPNAYELSLLASHSLQNRHDALHALRAVQAKGPRIVVVSSFIGTDTPANMLDIMAVDGPAAWRLTLPLIAGKFFGAGDVFAALFLHFWLPNRDTAAALGQACAALSGILAQTARRGASELALIEAQDTLAAPSTLYAAERLA
jgi:pyridoxine kinase